MVGMTATIKVDMDDFKQLIKDIAGLQTYKMFEGDEELYINREDIIKLLIEHMETKRIK